MSFVYDVALTRDTDKVRLLIGDTDKDDFDLHDEEISYFLTENGDSVKGAAIASAEAIAAKFAKLATTRVGEESINYSDLAKQAWALVDKLKGKINLRAGIRAGGTDIEGIGGEAPAFTRGLHETSIVVVAGTTSS